MIDWVAVLQCVCIILNVLLFLCYAYQIVYLIVPLFLKDRNYDKPVKQYKYAIMIAARNEEKVIPHLLDSIKGQDYPAELITTFVVADNCTDNTALVAQEHGAVVFPRFSTEKVGKGYALNYLIDKIDETAGLDSFDAFLIFDADNLLLSDYVSKINHVHADGYEAFCGYRNTKNFHSSWVSAGYGVWYLHDSAHLNRSRMALGACCMVNGTGFGFTRQLLKRIGQWEFFTLTEDIEFSIWCASHGVKIGYCNDAILFDEQPLTFPQSWRQRTRWAQGGIQICFKRSGELFRGLFKGGWRGYSCLEFATLSTWGYMIGVLIGAITALTVIASFGAQPVFGMLPALLLFLYMSMVGAGALTVVMEWNRIRAKTRHKLLGIFAYPLYLITFVPIAMLAPFRKFEWTPVAHTEAVSMDELATEEEQETVG